MANSQGKRVVVVPLRPGCDGDPTHRPTGSSFTEVDPPTLYLEKIATKWMKARGEAQAGVSYILDRLPQGYALYQKPRQGKPSHVDKWLYGHPRHRPFDSPNRFYPHFEWLMENDGDSIGCPCSVCVKGGVLHSSSSRPTSKGSSRAGSFKSSPPNRGPPLRAASASSLSAAAGPSVPSAPQAKGRPKMALTGMDASRIDEEGTPDVYRNLIDKLKRYQELDETIMEPLSMDWRSEQAILPELLQKLKEEAQWVPRVGDIVLYIRQIPEGLELLQNEDTGEHQFFDPDTETFAGAPVWEAGLVGQAPEEPVDLNDAVHEGDKETSISLSGVRVEPLPNPNDKNKSISKRYRYVPVSHTRPFFLWKYYLEHIEEEDWNPTIRNALTAMSSFALMGRHRFKGRWPTADLYCHGIYIGAEFLAVGDTVRLLPKAGEEESTDVMIIKSIRLHFKNLDRASINDYDDGHPYDLHAWVYGPAYTTEASKSSKEWVHRSNIDTPKAAAGYSRWYPLHPVTKELAVPFSRILGRLYEHGAMSLWIPSTPNIDQGRESVLEARQYAQENDNRIISSPGCQWFWGESRAGALDLHTINGLEVGKYDTERDPKEWRKRIKILEGVSKTQDQKGKAPFTGAKSLRSFMAPASATLPVRSQVLAGENSGSSTGSSAMNRRKRGHVVDVSDEDEDEEEDEEIRHHTRIVDAHPTSSQPLRAKKPRVMVRVD
ncbi:hypothetical protein CC80DRAFT_493737 [Byssothecium circinans]|uniref:Cryptic loci regulator 2 N-terminal domain-containing protein n=1 Tax=Byssothecium circinans TaxID=147558 RepID=A0A6A5TQB8_9PLEO|nr:hypothetical protein CC80DRAFT_493737 [Byssothecium circinans]